MVQADTYLNFLSDSFNRCPNSFKHSEKVTGHVKKIEPFLSVHFSEALNNVSTKSTRLLHAYRQTEWWTRWS